VAEDIARFVWDDPILLERLKKIRHATTVAEKKLFKASILRIQARDVLKDFGKSSAIKTEQTRKTTGNLFVANLKRAQESLRSLEEFSKLAHSPVWMDFKKIRYQCYAIEELAIPQVYKH
jgi:thiamine-phosphate pyrophosphorylase